MLRLSDLGTNQFTSHRTRLTSTAARAGLSFDAIRLTDGWSKSSQVCARFYNRPILDNQAFANVVLNSVSTTR
nr:unnamed protein product [Callosobruchus analis]